jgi:hypothetical protein
MRPGSRAEAPSGAAVRRMMFEELSELQPP